MNKQFANGALYGGNPPQGTSTESLIINVCLSGNITNKSINPHVPGNLQEITENAAQVIEAGASMLHIHAYDADGLPCWHPESFAPIFENIRANYPERTQLAADNTFVALPDGQLVGVASYIVLDELHADTASLAVDPEYLGYGIGYQLQLARLEEMRSKDIKHLRTESDRPEVIHWYINKFAYRITGENPKKHNFGHPDYAH